MSRNEEENKNSTSDKMQNISQNNMYTSFIFYINKYYKTKK